MEQITTISCKLQVSIEQVAELNATLKAFADACDWINHTVDPELTNSLRIQALVYGDVRKQFGLSSNLTIRAIGRVAANRKTAQRKHKPVRNFAPTSIDYDARIFSFRESDWTVSLTLLNKRERFKLNIGNFQRGRLAGKKPTSATLVKRRDGSFYLQIQIKTQAPEPTKGSQFLGVDLGRRDIAHTSEGQPFPGEPINQVRNRYARQRTSLQHKASKGTRSTRRRCRGILRRLSGREKRFQAWVNHGVSFRIVKSAAALKAVIVLEDLKGIREGINKKPRSTEERRKTNSWAFHQLRTFLAYKAMAAGVRMILVPPAYTSKGCSGCFHLGQRSEKVFRCSHCNTESDADFNAAKLISILGAALVNPPGGPAFACRWPVTARAAESSVHTL